jgi:hypothetical protein
VNRKITSRAGVGAGLQGAGDLQGGGDAGRVVGRAGRVGDGVVVAHHQHGGRVAIGARQGGDDVLHRADRHRAGRPLGGVAHALAGTHQDLQAQAVDAREQVVAHPDDLGRADRVRLAADGPDVGHGAGGRELVGGGVGRQGRRRSQGQVGDGQAQQQTDPDAEQPDGLHAMRLPQRIP